MITKKKRQLLKWYPTSLSPHGDKYYYNQKELIKWHIYPHFNFSFLSPFHFNPTTHLPLSSSLWIRTLPKFDIAPPHFNFSFLSPLILYFGSWALWIRGASSSTRTLHSYLVPSTSLPSNGSLQQPSPQPRNQSLYLDSEICLKIVYFQLKLETLGHSTISEVNEFATK